MQGSESFRGFITHSFTYRRPEVFAGQAVALLGGSLSAQDISLQLKDYAEKVLFSPSYFVILENLVFVV